MCILSLLIGQKKSEAFLHEKVERKITRCADRSGADRMRCVLFGVLPFIIGTISTRATPVRGGLHAPKEARRSLRTGELRVSRRGFKRRPHA